MAISNQQQQYKRSSFVPLDQLPTGTGESGRYLTDITGQLVGIEPRDGSYQITDRRTGQVITRPNSYTAHFADGSMFSWPTYLDESGHVQMWSRFEAGLSLAQIIQQGIVIHLWKDERNFTHLEVVAQQQQVQPISQANRAPWEM